MLVEDPIYGSFEVEPVLAELIESPPFRRLRNIHRGGAIFLVTPDINHTRYEHSIGVLFLVKYLRGEVQEQIAALLHDISHTAFSHVVDYVFENQKEDYHELVFEQVVVNSTIPSILNKYGFDTSLLHSAHYSILEQPLPDLCADRLDYTLRDLFHAKLISKTEIQDFLLELTLCENKMTVKSQRAAEWIVTQYKILNENYFRKPEHIYANLKMAELIRYGLSSGILTEPDLLTDDHQVLMKLSANNYCDEMLASIKVSRDLDDFLKQANLPAFKQRELIPKVLGL